MYFSSIYIPIKHIMENVLKNCTRGTESQKKPQVGQSEESLVQKLVQKKDFIIFKPFFWPLLNHICVMMLSQARTWLKCSPVVIWGFCCCSVIHNREQTFSLIIISWWADGFLLLSSLWLVMQLGEVWWIWPSEKCFRRGRNKKCNNIRNLPPFFPP